MKKYYEESIDRFLESIPKTELEISYWKINIYKYLASLVPVTILSFILYFHHDLISSAKVNGYSYLNFLLISAITTPVLALSTNYALQKIINSSGNNRKLDTIVRIYFQEFPTVILGISFRSFLTALIFKTFLYLNGQTSIKLFFLLVINSLFITTMLILNNARRKQSWRIAWIIYVVLFYFDPTLWFLAPAMATAYAIYDLKKILPKIKINFKINKFFNPYAINGVILGLILWSDKIVLFLYSPEKFDANYIFISMLPCVLTLNYYYIFVQRDLVDRINTLLWGISQVPLQKYVKFRDESFQRLHLSLIKVLMFSVITSIAMWFLARNNFENQMQFAKNLILMVLITNFFIFYNIRLYFHAGFRFYLSTGLIIAGITNIVLSSSYTFKHAVTLSFGVFLVAHIIASIDLAQWWRRPHREVLDLT